MRPRKLCILAKNGNLWILFVHGFIWDMAIFTVDINYAKYTCICVISVLFA